MFILLVTILSRKSHELDKVLFVIDHWWMVYVERFYLKLEKKQKNLRLPLKIKVMKLKLYWKCLPPIWTFVSALNSKHLLSSAANIYLQRCKSDQSAPMSLRYSALLTLFLILFISLFSLWHSSLTAPQPIYFFLSFLISFSLSPFLYFFRYSPSLYSYIILLPIFIIFLLTHISSLSLSLLFNICLLIFSLSNTVLVFFLLTCFSLRLSLTLSVSVSLSLTLQSALFSFLLTRSLFFISFSHSLMLYLSSSLHLCLFLSQPFCVHYLC